MTAGGLAFLQGGLSEEVTWSRALSIDKKLPCKDLGKNVPARGDSKCKVPEVGTNSEKLEDWVWLLEGVDGELRLRGRVGSGQNVEN